MEPLTNNKFPYSLQVEIPQHSIFTWLKFQHKRNSWFFYAFQVPNTLLGNSQDACIIVRRFYLLADRTIHSLQLQLVGSAIAEWHTNLQEHVTNKSNLRKGCPSQYLKESQCMRAKRSPGNVKKAPTKPHHTAKNNLNMSWEAGPLWQDMQAQKREKC